MKLESLLCINAKIIGLFFVIILDSPVFDFFSDYFRNMHHHPATPWIKYKQMLVLVFYFELNKTMLKMEINILIISITSPGRARARAAAYTAMSHFHICSAAARCMYNYKMQIYTEHG